MLTYYEILTSIKQCVKNPYSAKAGGILLLEYFNTILDQSTVNNILGEYCPGNGSIMTKIRHLISLGNDIFCLEVLTQNDLDNMAKTIYSSQ